MSIKAGYRKPKQLFNPKYRRNRIIDKYADLGKFIIAIAIYFITLTCTR